MDLFSPRKVIGALLKMRFVRDILTLQVGNIVATGIGFLRSIIIARLLGLTTFGEYAVVLAMTNVFETFLNVGQSQATLIFFSEQFGKKHHEGMARVLRYYGILTVYSVVLLCIFILLAHPIAQALYHDEQIGTFAQLEFLAALIGSWTPMVQTVIQAVRKIKLLIILQNIENVLQLLFMTIFLMLGWGIGGIFTGLIASNVIMFILYTIQYVRLQKEFHLPTIRDVLRTRIHGWEYFVQGFWIAVDKNVSGLLGQGSLMVLSFLAPRSVVGIAQLAYKVGMIPSMIFLPQVQQMTMSTLPAIAQQGTEKLRKTCALLIKHALFVHACISIAVMPFIPFFVLIFYGPSYGAVIEPALWFALIQIMSALAIVNTSLFRTFRKTYIPAFVRAAVFPFEIAALLIVAHFFSPITGFIAAFFVAYMSNHILSVYLYYFLKKKHTASNVLAAEILSPPAIQ